MKKSFFILLFLISALSFSSCGASGRSEQLEASERPQLIAHAGGAIWGFRYSNSLEALDEAYKNGFRYIELDLELTSDGEIVLIHDWESMAERMLFSEGVRTREEFLSSPVFMSLTLLDASGLRRWMDGHKDAYIITDVKQKDNAALLEKLKSILGGASARIIPQIYSFDEYEAVISLGYPDVILTVYRIGIESEELGAFIKSHKLWAVTVHCSRLTEELLNAAGETPVYAHTVNTLGDFEAWRPLGLDGVYTDYFSPEHWPYN